MRTVRTLSTRRSAQQGFTMIELIVVIVILGILAATALPKFIDMSDDASKAAVAGVAGAAGAAMNLNMSGCALTGNVVTANKCVKVSSCATASVAAIMQGGALPNASYTSAFKAGGADLTTTNGNTTTCTMTLTSGTKTWTSDFVGTSAGN